MREIWWTWSGSNRRPPRRGRGALSFDSWKHLSIPELSDEISSSFAAARGVSPEPKYQTALDIPASKVPARELKSSVRTGVLPGEPPVVRRNRYRIFCSIRFFRLVTTVVDL